MTLIGEELAKEGLEFIYLGPINNCRSCKLKTVCFNLKPGSQYLITKVRDKQHHCDLHEGNAMVVEVKQIPPMVAIDGKLSEGSTTEIEQQKCGRTSCEYYTLCNHRGVHKGKKYQVIKVYEAIECPKKYSLQKAEVAE